MPNIIVNEGQAVTIPPIVLRLSEGGRVDVACVLRGFALSSQHEVNLRLFKGAFRLRWHRCLIHIREGDSYLGEKVGIGASLKQDQHLGEREDIWEAKFHDREFSRDRP